MNTLYLLIETRNIYGYIIPKIQPIILQTGDIHDLILKLQGLIIAHDIDVVYYDLVRGTKKTKTFLKGALDCLFLLSGIKRAMPVDMEKHYLYEARNIKINWDVVGAKSQVSNSDIFYDAINDCGNLLISVAIYSVLHYQKELPEILKK